MTFIKIARRSILACCPVGVVSVGSLSHICYDLLKVLIFEFLMGSVFDGEELFYVFIDASLV